MPQGFALLTEEQGNLSSDKLLGRSSMQTNGVSLRIGHATLVVHILPSYPALLDSRLMGSAQ
jgi:hypothetical protein